MFLTGARGDELTGDWAFDEFGLLLSGHAGGSMAGTPIDRRGGRLDGPRRPQCVEALPRYCCTGGLRSSGAEPVVRSWRPWVSDRLRQRTDLADLIFESRMLPRFGGIGRSTRFARVSATQSARLAVHAERRLARAGMVAADPYADRRLAELVLALPAWLVQRRSEPKRLARRALTGIVPEPARLDATKTIPSALYDRGLRDRASATVDALLTSSVAAEHGWLNADAVHTAHDRYRRTGQVTHDYWWVLTTELWLRRWWT
jgi:hypothetical protein